MNLLKILFDNLSVMYNLVLDIEDRISVVSLTIMSFHNIPIAQQKGTGNIKVLKRKVVFKNRTNRNHLQ